MNYIRRGLFAIFNAAQVIGLIWLVVNAPNLLAGSTFEANPRLLDGTPVESPLQLIDKETIVIIQVWFSTHCAACESQIELLKDYHNPPYVYVIGVNVGDSEKQVSKYLEELGIEFPIIIGLPQPPTESGGNVPFTQVYLLTESGQFQMFDQWSGGPLFSDKAENLLAEIDLFLQSQEGEG